MKKLLIAVLFLCFGITSMNPSFANTEPENDSALLAQLSARSKAIQSLQGHFIQQKKIAVLPAPLNSTGQFRFEQGREVIWEVLTPVKNTVHLTPKGISFEDSQHSQAVPQQAGVEVVARIFMGVIAGELESLDSYFEVRATGDVKHWQLVLTPRSQNLAAYIQNITLQGSEFTEQLDIAETNGDKTNIRFITDKVVAKAK